MKGTLLAILLLITNGCTPTSQQNPFPSNENTSLLLFYNEITPARYSSQIRQVQAELERLQENTISKFHILVPTAFKVDTQKTTMPFNMAILIESAPLNDLEIVRSEIETRNFRSIWARSGETLLMPMQNQVSVIETDFKLISLETRSTSFHRLNRAEKLAVINQENKEMRKYAFMPEFQSFSTPGNLYVRIFSAFQLSGLLEVTNSNAYFGTLKRLEKTNLMIFRRLNPGELNPDYL